MFDIEQVNELIRRRRTIKPLTKAGEINYADRPIERQVIENLLENANWAPTHGLTEPWRFNVFTGDARRRLAEYLRDAYGRLIDPDIFRQKKQDKMYNNALHAACTLSIGMERHDGRIPAEEEIEAVACAMQNLHLTATAHGLGGFWSSSPIYDHPETRAFLGLGADDRCLGLFFLGYPKSDWPDRPNGGPGPIAEKVIWHE